MQKQSELITLLRETICKESPERLPKLHKVNDEIRLVTNQDLGLRGYECPIRFDKRT